MTNSTLDEILLEIKLLRKVYEDSRSVLRDYGINSKRFIDALSELDNSIEEVKLLDSGYYGVKDL